MKTITYSIITLLITICILPINVFAVGDISISATNLNIPKGSSATFTITTNNALGRIDISSTNPDIASVSDSKLFLDMETGTITVNGISVGTTTIKIYAYDVTGYDYEDLTGKEYTINVNVISSLKGDMNSDKKLTITDVIKLLRIYLNLEPEESDTLIIGDMNEDGSITITDVIKLLRIYLNLE